MTRKSFITVLWISLAVALFFFTFFTSEKDQTLTNALLTLAVTLMYSLVISVGNGIVNSELDRRFSWTGETRIRVLLGVVFSLIVNVGLVLVCNYVNFVFLQGIDPSTFFSGEMAVSNWLIINITLLIAAILHAKGFMEAWKKASKQEVVEQKIIARSANAQFESLKNQLDPHFLFNSLNVLSSLIDENPEQAQRFTASMSKIYRYVLEQKDKELVTVEEEIEFAKTYCNLLKTRFENSVEFEFDVPAEVKNHYVVPLSLQLLLENCIKHNYATSQNPLRIKIFCDDGFLQVENNLQKREQVKESAGIGLANIVQRYSLLSTKQVRIDQSETFFRVKIPILIHKLKTMFTQPSGEALAYQRATERVAELKSFYGHLAAYCIVISALTIINLLTAPDHLWFYWPMLGWGIGIASHALKTFGISKNWEEKQIQKILKNNKNQ